MNWITSDVLLFLLVMGRIVGVMVAAPIFSNKNIPRIVKVNFAFLMTIIIFPLVEQSTLITSFEGNAFFLYLINEILFGVSIGLFITIFLSFINVAGAIIDRNIGFSMVSVISPLSNTQIPVTANFLYVITMLLFLGLNFHHILIRGMVASFEHVPMGYFFYNSVMVEKLVEVFTYAFTTGVVIAAPFIIVILIANLILGLLSKAMPGMNVFVIGMPFKIFFGFIIMIVLMPYMVDKIVALLTQMFDMLMEYTISV